MKLGGNMADLFVVFCEAYSVSDTMENVGGEPGSCSCSRSMLGYTSVVKSGAVASGRMPVYSGKEKRKKWPWTTAALAITQRRARNSVYCVSAQWPMRPTRTQPQQFLLARTHQPRPRETSIRHTCNAKSQLRSV